MAINRKEMVNIFRMGFFPNRPFGEGSDCGLK